MYDIVNDNRISINNEYAKLVDTKKLTLNIDSIGNMNNNLDI